MAHTFRTAPPRIDVGSVGRFRGDKLRPAVVFAVDVDENGTRWLHVALGTGTHRPDLQQLAIEPDRRFGKMLKLTKTTYFDARKVSTVRESEGSFEPLAGRWPLPFVLRLIEIVRTPTK